MILVGFGADALATRAALLSIGLFASIYHSVGTAMIVSYAEQAWPRDGLNGVWGNLGVRVVRAGHRRDRAILGWRYASSFRHCDDRVGVAFAMLVVHEDRTGTKQARRQARVAKKDMWRVILGCSSW